MEYSRLGNHELSVCPWCDKLYHVLCDGLLDEIVAIQEQHDAHLDESAECRKQQDALPSMADLQKELGPAFREADESRAKRAAENPDNGTAGWWRVEGIWESPEASFIGAELPDVF